MQLRSIHRRPRWRVAATSAAANSRALCFVFALVLVSGAEVGGQPTTSSSSVRTVMDLMEVMLNRDILDMLANGGYDFRQPARIFLPPKFYSSTLFDRGHMSPEEILSALSTALQPSPTSSPSSSPSSSSSTQRSPSFSSNGGRADQQRRATAGRVGSADGPGNGNGFNFAGKEQVVVLDAPDGSRINLISYSDSKVTSPTTGAVGVGGKPGGLKSNPAPSQWQQQHGPLTSSITDQTVSPNGARPLPAPVPRTSTAANGRSSPGTAGTGSPTDRLRSALPGEPDVDYPIFGRIPETTFSCDKRHHGYYADVEARCQVFRVCANTDSTGRGFAFLCPNGTLFNQRHLVCDWYTNVRCADSESFYHVNEDIGRMMASGGRSMVSDSRREMMHVVMSMVTYPMRTLMEQMDGVGVLEERRFGLAGEAIDSTRASGQPPLGPSRPVPVRTELEPPVADVGARPTLPTAGTLASPGQAYAPRVDDVYVSSLGTLSTDPDSGFDPVRSTLLTRTGFAPSGSTQQATHPTAGFAGLPQPNRVSGEIPSVISKPGPSSVQLIKTDLVKTWNRLDSSPVPQATPLRLEPVAPPLPVFVPRPEEPQRLVENFRQPTAWQNQELLAPIGVLPPTSFSRLATTGQQPHAGNHFTSDSEVVYGQHRFTPVNKVLSVQKVTVQPEHPYQAFGGAFEAQGVAVQPPQAGYVTQENLYHNHGAPGGSFAAEQPAQENLYQPTSPPAVGSVQAGHFGGSVYDYHTAGDRSFSLHYEPAVQQAPFGSVYPQPLQHSSTLLRRNDGPLASRGGGSLFKRKKAVLVQVVPAVSFYLNNAQEKRAYDEAIRRGLLDEWQRASSYDVPQGSVGRLLR